MWLAKHRCRDSNGEGESAGWAEREIARARGTSGPFLPLDFALASRYELATNYLSATSYQTLYFAWQTLSKLLLTVFDAGLGGAGLVEERTMEAEEKKPGRPIVIVRTVLCTSTCTTPS